MRTYRRVIVLGTARRNPSTRNKIETTHTHTNIFVIPPFPPSTKYKSTLVHGIPADQVVPYKKTSLVGGYALGLLLVRKLHQNDQ